MDNNGKIKLELTSQEISILSNAMNLLIIIREASRPSHDKTVNKELDELIREYQKINKKLCDAVSGME
jgi:hypothetical protein|nr:MAG TPA: hypothetical protein [Caudoviricetes sp.]